MQIINGKYKFEHWEVSLCLYCAGFLCYRKYDDVEIQRDWDPNSDRMIRVTQEFQYISFRKQVPSWVPHHMIVHLSDTVAELTHLLWDYVSWQ